MWDSGQYKADGISPELRADLSTAVQRIRFHKDTDSSMVLQALMPARVGVRAARRPSQDFQSLHVYGTASFWRVMVDKTTNTISKLELLLNLASHLGLRLPSEPCLKYMTSLWLICSYSKDTLSVMSTQEKHTYYEHVKKTWLSVRARCAAPKEWVKILPSSALEYSVKFPETWNRMFAGGEIPVEAAIDLGALMQFDQSYRCRGGATKEVGSFKDSSPQRCGRQVRRSLSGDACDILQTN